MKTSKLNEWPPRAAMGKWSAILLMAVGLQSMVAPRMQAATSTKEITDSGITSAVEGGLRMEIGVSPNDVDVSTSQGIVTLSGSQPNLLAKERTGKIAESIRGVLGVIDRVTVKPVSRPDEDIRKDILMALLQDPATENYQVAVSVQNAMATLTGTVGSYAEKQFAARIAKGIKGVKEVRNDVTINYLAKRTDAEIAADAKARLAWDIWINGDPIKVAVKDGQVTLSGTVGSAVAHMRAFDDAWVNGVTSVDDRDLKVDPRARHEAHQKHTFALGTDSEITRAVQVALRMDPRVSVVSPEVNVESGVVILGGQVESLKAKAAAGQDAKNILGVWRVDNLLKVRPKTWPSDEEMQKQLRATLSWDPLLDSSTIDSAVINRVAYLSGAVESSFQKTEAHDVASRIKGVALVINHLNVEPEVAFGFWDWPYYSSSPYYVSESFGPQPYLSDEQIKKNIENAFFWSPFVHSEDITVTVDGGVATLTGKVGTWIGYGEADKDARKSGATAVRNRLKVS